MEKYLGPGKGCAPWNSKRKSVPLKRIYLNKRPLFRDRALPLETVSICVNWKNKSEKDRLRSRDMVGTKKRVERDERKERKPKMQWQN